MEEHSDFQNNFENTSISNFLMLDILQPQTPQAPESSKPAHPPHSYREEKRDGKKVYLCTVPDCGKTFKYKSEVTRHIIAHNESRPYNCTVEGCSMSFKRIDGLQVHMFRLHAKKRLGPDDKPECDTKLAADNNGLADSDQPIEQTSQLNVETTKQPDPNYFTFKDIEEISRKPEEVTPGRRLDLNTWVDWKRNIQESGDKIDWKLFYNLLASYYSIHKENTMLREEFREKYHVSSNDETTDNITSRDN